MTFNEEQRAAVKKFSETAAESAHAGTLVNLVFSSGVNGELLKIKGTLRVIRQNRVMQLENYFSEGRVSQENISYDEIEERITAHFGTAFYRIDLNDKNGTASLMMSKKGRVTALIPGTLKRALSESVSAGISDAMMNLGGNDRLKNHLLTGKEPFLIELGISDRNGRVHDKRQSKFRQICRFSELVMEQIPHLPKDGMLEIADLCCGKSYLSFAVYHVLKYIAGRDVKMVCMDLKKSVMDFCAKTADKLGYDGMRFICGDIADYAPDRPPDMVISLHACDTATDIVLDFAARWQAAVILSTPCCQRELSKNLSCETLSFIADRPVLRRKFCDAATDALRLLRLECMGYTADALEFIDPEDTPKNVMLRAVRRKNVSLTALAITKKREEYRAAYTFLTGTEPSPFSE